MVKFMAFRSHYHISLVLWIPQLDSEADRMNCRQFSAVKIGVSSVAESNWEVADFVNEISSKGRIFRVTTLFKIEARLYL